MDYYNFLLLDYISLINILHHFNALYNLIFKEEYIMELP